MRTFNIALSLLALSLLIGVGAVARADTTPRPQIVGGADVPDPNPYTYQVSIGTVDSYFCGGSIIAADWVLSAAHCFVDENTGAVTDATTLVVRTGIRSIQAGFDDTTGNRAVAQLTVHPAYDRGTSANDIALLKLAAPVDAAWIVPLADAANDPALTVPGTNAIATGWGGTIGYGPNDPTPTQPTIDILRFVEMPIASNTTCGITATQLCAGLPGGGVDTCQGDSGGPLVVSDGAAWYIQVGVVSNGAGCAAPGFYGTYTRVGSYRSWIDSTMNPVDPSTIIPRAYLPLIVR
ncbi:serine protease [Oscillochloris sp. ZM17-4]|uniref:S1 family serine peptidase n=1 Tax=Oscillochloris sp. ZM17-4 TaxID=2866714 RepID=UPI001C73941C|nr:serine protease [Oscillochloris sp. ZM17-4]MBX0326147.1 serine protease [Oscillochloris sp. ZM17-4]